jgi:N-acetylneuraminic acid mutarotase
MVIKDDAGAQVEAKDMIRWTIGGWMPKSPDGSPHLGLAGAEAGIHRDALIIAGGSNFPEGMPWTGGPKRYYKTGYIFDMKQKKIVYADHTFELPFNIAYGGSCSTPFGVLILGGESEDGLSNKALLIQWDESAKTIRTQILQDLPFPVTNASVTVHGTVVFLAGGETADGVSNKFLCFDLSNRKGTWKILPSIPKPVSHAVMVVQNNGSTNCIYLMGGRRKNRGSTSEFYSSTFRFNLKTNVWTEMKNLPYAVSAGTGVAHGRNQIFLFGGDKGETFNKIEALIVAINAEGDSLKRLQLNEEKIKIQVAHPGFSRDVLMYDTVLDTWTCVGSIPFESPVTTCAVKLNEDTVVIPVGEIKSGTRTPQILEGKFVIE